jgi:putative ABC transport system ATP-binding protein
MSLLLEAKDISHSFDYKLFDNIDITLQKGESTAIIGVSGSGKSTLLHILSTLLKPQTGSVLYSGKEIYNLNQKEILDIRRYDMGIVFQSHYLFKGFNSKENVDISNILSNQQYDETLMRDLKIDDILDKNVSNISGGQQQRVSIARVLSKKPNIIFADEPTGNLDKQTARDVMDVIFNYIKKTNASMFMVTHDEDLAKECTHTFRLQDSKLVKWN